MRARRGGFFGATLACAWLVLAASAEAATLRSVRIGLHEDKTRIVLDLDSAAGHSVERRSARELWLHIEADALPEVIRGRGPLLRSIRIEPAVDARGGANVRLQLAREVEVKELVLENPPRVVIDLFDPSRAVAVATPATQPAARPKPKPPAPKAKVPARAQAERDARPDWVKEAAPPAPAAERKAAARPAREPARTAAKRAPAAAPLARKSESWLSRALAYATQPSGAAVLVFAALAAVVLWFFLRRGGAKRDARRRAREMLNEPLKPSASPARAPEKESAPSPAAAASAAKPVVSEAPKASEESDALAAPHIAATPPAHPSVAPTPARPLATPAPTSASAEADAPANIAEMEQKIASLMESKDRLERQASAQAEELRTLRAAIARTQRVLRSMPRSEDADPSDTAQPGLPTRDNPPPE